MRSTALMLLLLPLVVWADDNDDQRCSAFYNNYKSQAISMPCFKLCLPSGSDTGAMCNRTISFDPAAHQEMCYEFYEVNGLSNCPEECGGKCERPTTTATETSGSVLTTTDTSSQSPSSTASTVPSTASETTSTGDSSAETSSTATSSETVTTSEPTSSENTTANPDLGSIVTIPPLGDPSTNGSTSSESSTASSSSSSTSDEETTAEAITTTSAAEKSPEMINTPPTLPSPLPEETPEPRIPLTDDETDDPRLRQRTGRPHRRAETTEKEEGGGSLLWLWIILGVGGSLVVLALITLIAIRCMKKRKEKNKKEAQKSDVESGRSAGLSNQQLPLPPPNATPLGAPPGRPVKRRPAHKKQKEKNALPLKEMALGKVDAEHFNFEGPLVVDATGIHGELKHGTDGEKSRSIKDVVFDDKLNHVYDMGSDIEVVVQSVEKTIDGGNSMSTVEGGNTVKETAPTSKAAAPKEAAKKAEKK